MATYSNIAGVMGSRFQLAGPTGPAWRADAGGLEARNAADSAYIVGRGADPVAVNDWVTLGFLNSIGFPLLAQGILSYPTTGSPPQDDVLWTLPNKQLIQYVLFRPETVLVGAGTITLRAGTTVGGNEMLLDQAITAATVAGPAAGQVYGLDIGEVGLGMLGQLGYAYLGNAGDVVRSRMSVAGVVTAGTIQYWVFGIDLG